MQVKCIGLDGTPWLAWMRSIKGSISLLLFYDAACVIFCTIGNDLQMVLFISNLVCYKLHAIILNLKFSMYKMRIILIIV